MSKKILIVEPTGERRSAAAILAEAGYQTLRADSASSATQQLFQEPEVDVLVVDLGVPGLDGMALVKEMRQNPDHRKTRVIIISDESAEMQKGDEPVELAGWMFKPYKPEQLLTLVRIILMYNGSLGRQRNHA